MFWADRIAKEIGESRKPKDGSKFIIRDEKTLSGRVHIGSMRGVAIHGVVSEALNEGGNASEYVYELNDFDPLDSIPSYLDQEKYTEHLGRPLYAVPSPEVGFENYAEYFGAEFIAVHKKAGFAPRYYRTYADLYKAGKMDALIKTALERASNIRKILKDVSGSQKAEDWLPVSVVCQVCGKMMTTSAFDWDGSTVAYKCERNPDGAVACGHEGRISPFGGAAKLFWKTDWAAKWAAVGVDIEGAGKDHSTKGGSRDVANHISQEIYSFVPPFDIPYEFFLVGGQKMSSSKGRGSSAKDIADLFPPEVLRLALIGRDINQQINVDPSGDSVPTMYDWYDEIAEAHRSGKGDDFARLYEYCQLPGANKSAPWQMRFRDVAFIAQMPHANLVMAATDSKGAKLTDQEIKLLTEREKYALYWLQTYAPAEFVYRIQESLPNVTLSDKQKQALNLLLEYLAEPHMGEDIHKRLHELKDEVQIPAKELFGAIYRIFLDRDSGPKAGWFLGSLNREFLIKRLKEAVA